MTTCFATLYPLRYIVYTYSLFCFLYNFFHHRRFVFAPKVCQRPIIIRRENGNVSNVLHSPPPIIAAEISAINGWISKLYRCQTTSHSLLCISGLHRENERNHHDFPNLLKNSLNTTRRLELFIYIVNMMYKLYVDRCVIIINTLVFLNIKFIRFFFKMIRIRGERMYLRKS